MSSPDAIRRDRAAAVVRRLREHGFQAYFVGGCVRDLVLNRQPDDYDVATSAQPAEVLRLFPGSLEVGMQFGVVLVVEDSQEIAVATFRSDERYLDGRHPQGVVYTLDARQDVARRDFTINGLLYDPLSPGPEEERVIDYVGGRAELRPGLSLIHISEPTRPY